MLTPYCCTHCGFWQRRFALPLTCPVCEDYRHPLPHEGYRFLTPEEVDAAYETVWREVLPDVVQFSTRHRETGEPLGIGPRGLLLLRPAGNIAFEGSGWYSDAALDHVASLGGVRYLAASHGHVFGAVWRLDKRFSPEAVFHAEQLPLAQALRVRYTFDDRWDLAPGVELIHTGGHTPGHCVLHWAERGILFCGDAIKFTLDADPVGRPLTVSTHKAFDAHIPLTRGDLLRLRAHLQDLEFDAVVTPWEVVVPGAGGKAAAMAAIERQLADRPTADALPICDPQPDTTDPPQVRAFRAALPAGPEIEFPITGLDRTGVPVWTANLWPDAHGGEWTNGIGYGPTDGRARTGTWGELVEFCGLTDACRELRRTVASYNELTSRGIDTVDPLSLRLPVGTAYTPDGRRVWVAARRYNAAKPQAAHEEVLMPLEAVACTFADLGDDWPRGEGGIEPLFTPISNGSGAGDTFERALSHALLELVQRDGNSAGYRAVDRGLGIHLDSVADPQTLALLHRLDRLGIDVTVKLADVTLGMVSLYVVGHDRDPNHAPHPIMLTACGEAADPDRERALNKALHEFCASRVRKLFTHGPIPQIEHVFPPAYWERFRQHPPESEEGRSFHAVREWMSLSPTETLERLRPKVLNVERTVRFSSLPTVAPGTLTDPARLLRAVVERFEEEGHPIFYVHRVVGEGCHAVKAVAPRMEVETMTYGRIGVRNLRRLIDRGWGFVGLGDPPADRPAARRVPLDDASLAELGGPAWWDPDAADAAVGDLYAMYREPEVHVIALRELAATG